MTISCAVLRMIMATTDNARRQKLLIEQTTSSQPILNACVVAGAEKVWLISSLEDTSGDRKTSTECYLPRS
jgi:hypothetical protein